MKKKLFIILSLMTLVGCQTNKQVETPSTVLPEREEEEVEVVKPQIMFPLTELPDDERMTLQYLGRDDQFDIYYSTPYSQGMGNEEDTDKGLMFYFTFPSTFDVVKTGELEPLLSPKIKLIDHNIYVIKPDSILQLTNQFDDALHIEMPLQIVNEQNLFGFDVSDDLSQFIYSNLDGLWYLSDRLAEPVLLRAPFKFPENPFLEFGYYMTPTFINDSKEVLVDVGAYEASAGYVFCDLESLTCDEEASRTQQNLSDLMQNQLFLQVATSTGEKIPWRYHWVNLKDKSTVDDAPMELVPDDNETRQIDDYVQQGDRMYFAIGTRDAGKFLPKYIDIEAYQIEEDMSLTFIKQLARIDEIAVTLLGATPEGKVIYSYELDDSTTSSAQLKISITE